MKADLDRRSAKLLRARTVTRRQTAFSGHGETKMSLHNRICAAVHRAGFDPHGERLNRIEGRILISTFQGPFNVELLRMSGAAALALRRSLMETGPWGYVENIERNAIATPEAIAEMKRANEDPMRNRNRIAAAVVIPNGVEGGRVAESIYTKVWRDVAHPFRVFDTFAEARDWIAAQIPK